MYFFSSFFPFILTFAASPSSLLQCSFCDAEFQVIPQWFLSDKSNERWNYFKFLKNYELSMKEMK